MDVNEEIVRAWMQIQGFLVKGRHKFLVRGNKKSAGWSDIDLICYRLYDNKRVAIDISAWMAETISLGYLNNPKYYHRMLKITDPEARKAIRTCFGVADDNQYEIWLVLSKISIKQREEVLKICTDAGIDRIIEFKEVMQDLITDIKNNPNPPREEESMQTIRALVLSGIL